EMDVYEEAAQPEGPPSRDRATRAAHGRGKSDVGLHADSRCPQESRTPGRPIDGRAHLEGSRSATRAEPPDVVADVSTSALGSDRRGRFLYGGGLDVARARDVLHRVRD